MSIKEYIVKNRETVQLVYGVLLILLIPLLILFNTIFIIQLYNKNLDVSLQRQALTIGRSIYSLIKDDLADNAKIQGKLDAIAQKSGDIKTIEVLQPKNNSFEVVASTDQKNINQKINFYYYQLALLQPEGDGIVTDSLRLAVDQKTSNTLDSNSNERFWLVAMPMSSLGGPADSILSLKISSKIVDDLTLYSRNSSVVMLVITIFIVILFLLVATRLWDYAILYQKIKQVDQMKDEFISIASHELRTPVTGIRGYASMMLDGSFGEINNKMKDGLTMIANASERLAVLVEDLLNVSRIEQGRMEIDAKPMNSYVLIDEVIKELKIQADAKNLQLVFKPHLEEMPLINIDNDKFKQVMINLVGNSIKYTLAGSVEVTTASLANKLEIKIKDTGIGMDAKERERLFEKFYRARNENTAKINGTGLGLWITKKIVEMMKGEISVDSMKGVGTQITIVFPIVK